ncbi:ABC transporter substrate-binding protein [Paucidesulfovibrio longus]|uniref:ABC transporter substrate-binding protein n=1 Tax=Paucidesulfovibrio longus TaxID=889 RepID=UPI0003B307E1|nr:ABC transporter substrate-binding protein [Paucidesulfovibrio longus]
MARIIAGLGVCLLCLALAGAETARAGEPLRFGVLGVLDTLPLQVAAHDGLFAAHGLDVELVPFASAMERDVAIQAGRLDGYFGDLIAALMLLEQGRPFPVSLVSYRTLPGQPMFGLALAPGRSGAALADLRGASVGYSRSTIMEFLLDKISDANGLPEDYFNRLEIKKIPIRLQMLLSGQIDAALLPEPLLSLARLKGGDTLLTAENLDIPLTVLCLHERYYENGAGEFRAFVAAYRDALQRLRENPERYRSLMAETCRIPAPLVPNFPVYAYPDPALPSPAEVDEVQDWMITKNMLGARLAYTKVVASSAP